MLIDVSRGNAAVELIVGAQDKRDLGMIDGFLSLYSVVPLTDGIGTRAYGLLKIYAKSHGLHLLDSLIAATAMENAFTLVTLNREHYQMIVGVKLQLPDYQWFTRCHIHILTFGGLHVCQGQATPGVGKRLWDGRELHSTRYVDNTIYSRSK